MQRKGLHTGDWVAVVVLGMLAIACGWVYRDFAQDDAFITYRYARNIASGQGFVYNEGEPVLGTTTPLYTLWLAFLGKICRQDIRSISHWTSVFSLWLGGIVLYCLGRWNGTLRAGAISLIFITNPLLMWSVGMETCFLNLFLMLALLSYVHNKMRLTGMFLGLLLLIRYETILFALIFAVHFIIKRKRIPWRLATGFPLCLVWAVFAWCTFGSIIPQSAAAKLVSKRLPFLLGAFVYWWLHVNHNAFSLLLAPLIAMGGYSAVRIQERRPGFLLILIWSIVYLFAASFVAGAFPWYYGPLIPAVAILTVWGSELLVGLSCSLFRCVRPHARGNRQVHSILLVGVLIVLTAVQIDLWTTVGTVHLGRRVDPRYTVYREAANWLNQNTQESETLATPEIGILGYYTNMRIIDLYGLVTPSLTPAQEEPISKTLERAIALYSPDYVITDKESLLQHLEQSSLYQPVRSFGGDDHVLYKDSRN
jgi:hypothetical protein